MRLSLVVRDRIEAIYVEFQSESRPPQIDFDQALYYIDGKPVERLREIVFKLQSHHDVDRNLYLAARDRGEGSINLIWAFEDGEYLVDDAGHRYPLRFLVEVLCGHVDHRDLSTHQVEYGGKLVTSVGDEGKEDLKAVVVEKRDGSISVLTSARAGVTLVGHDIDGVVSTPPRFVSDDERRLARLWKDYLNKLSSDTDSK
jgi:hypothetical protein